MATPKVLDFLYHDARRVGSVLAQLDEAGLLTSVKRSESKSATNKVSGQTALEGKIPLVGSASGNASLGREASKTGQLERTFDPLWQNARSFVEYAQGITKDLSEASIGQIVSISGSITIIDFNFLKDFMANKSIMDSLLEDKTSPEGNRQERRSHQKYPKNRSSDPPISELFGLFPYKIQMTIEADVEAWCTISEEFLVTQASDIVLKYGGALDGNWSVIGILDAVPSVFSGELIGNLDFDDGVEAFGMKLTKAMAPMARVLLGRPFSAYGITPLVVYREIGQS
jgi:hypothetical protein